MYLCHIMAAISSFTKFIFCTKVHFFYSRLPYVGYTKVNFLVIGAENFTCCYLYGFRVPSWHIHIYTVSQKMRQLWNGIAQNCQDRFWRHLAEIFKILENRVCMLQFSCRFAILSTFCVAEFETMSLRFSADVNTRHGWGDPVCGWYAILYNKCFRTRRSFDYESFTHCRRQSQWLCPTCSCIQVSAQCFVGSRLVSWSYLEILHLLL